MIWFDIWFFLLPIIMVTMTFILIFRSCFLCNGNFCWNLFHDIFPAVIRHLSKGQNKTSKECHITPCHLPWSWYWISNMAAHVLLSYIWYKQTSFFRGSKENIVMTKMKHLFQIQNLVPLVVSLRSTEIKLLQIYSCWFDTLDNNIYPWFVWCYFEWQSSQ